ncbi:MAG: hypothetical protein M3N07_03465 [Pseudomonadota bacterium]|nr:hypothetical protein [Pseudomonadota bacterium]
MPRHDAAALTALGERVRRPAFFAFLDIAGDPVRATTAGYDVTFAGTGDPELDGFTFSAVEHPELIDVGPVSFSEGGSATLVCTLSGIDDADGELLDAIADKSRWQGRVIRLWKMERDEQGAALGAMVPYFTGYMSVPEFIPSPGGSIIQLKSEHYLAALTAQPSNRSYLGQAEYDPADQSAKATIGAANGAKAGPGAAVGVVPGGGSAGGSRGGGPLLRSY